ncbi:DUF4377 domain-containing protein [Serratia marcescens]|nr:DUF4377 domain-containing protein [Serratia marcescens]MDQ9434272.1 DUF4377 domain-containing protein [Serratia marcescens]
MQVRRSAQQPWELFYTGIEGFTFEPSGQRAQFGGGGGQYQR